MTTTSTSTEAVTIIVPGAAAGGLRSRWLEGWEGRP
jgi:hypothetical protein